MGNNSVPKFIFRLSRFPVYRGSVLDRFYCITYTTAAKRCGRLLKTIISSVGFCISLHAGKGMQYVGILEDGPVEEDGANH